MVGAAFVAALLPIACGEGDARFQGGRLPASRVLGEGGRSPGQYAFPRAITTDGRTLWIVDKLARVQRIDPATGDCVQFWTMPQIELGMPVGLTVAMGPKGDPALYVVDTHNQRIVVYELPELPEGFGEATGQRRRAIERTPPILLTWGGYGVEPGQFIYPTDVAVLTAPDDPARVERIYVAEYGGNDRVSVFKLHEGEARFAFAFGRHGVGRPDDAEAVFNRPQTVVLDAVRRELIITDSGNHRIGRFTLDGELIAWAGSLGATARATDRVMPRAEGEAGEVTPGLTYPFGMILERARDGRRSAIVTENGGNRLHRIDLETGASLGVLGEPGRGVGQLASPWAIAALRGEVFVLDSGNNRVQVIPGEHAVTESSGMVATRGGAR
ncbi:MAG: hypothetical protein EA378_03610 [Phycisphaerales bacterium]|nr:MAG: hypothetical protein EA378_03610 [Phycisphaerales bacterium]